MKVGTDAMVLGVLCDFRGKRNLLDIGSGTGVLSLMAAQRFNPDSITSVELDPDAFRDLSENLAHSPFSARHISVCGNIFDQRFEEKFDGIISNPPFFEHSTKNPDPARSAARHTDELSFEKLLAFVSENLETNGAFWIIVPFLSREKLVELALSNKLHIAVNITIEGKPGKAVRSVMCFTFNAQPTVENVFTIRHSDGTYSSEYVELTKEFHGTKLQAE